MVTPHYEYFINYRYGITEPFINTFLMFVFYRWRCGFKTDGQNTNASSQKKSKKRRERIQSPSQKMDLNST